MASENESAPSCRPVNYTREIGHKICDELYEGKTLREICGADPAMPKAVTVLRWLLEHGEFREEYEWAREAQIEDLRHQAIAIADHSAGDWVEKVRRNGNIVTVLDRANIERCRLRSAIRRWVADRLAPQKPTVP